MGYRHIHNQYRPEVAVMLDLRRVVAMEKAHGTSAKVVYANDEIVYHAGGASHATFVGIFDDVGLLEKFRAMGHAEVTVYGEAYGGKEQGMSATYGKSLCFIAFEVQVGEAWLSVANAHDVVTKLGLEFVPYEIIECTIENLDRERDRPSIIAERRGMGTDKKREGIVIRPLVELRLGNGDRLISKHKNPEFQERGNQPAPTIDPAKFAAMEQATAIADEWVNDVRLDHVLDHLRAAGVAVDDIKATGAVIKEMVADVYREAKGEIVESKDAAQAIGKKASAMFKARVTQIRTGA